MRDKFITADFELDLSGLDISYTEENPRFNDTFFTKFSMPFDFVLDRDLKLAMGSYDDLNVTDLAKIHKGYHVFEGNIFEGQLEILEVIGNQITAQIDSGFDEIPNFTKKLSELPLEYQTVNNIYVHAETIISKQYPETNYNFPMVIYKHDTDDTGWEHFNQRLNDRNNTGYDGFVRNEVIDGVPINRNIVHPMPYLIYVLKTGFEDAGYELAGEILNDVDFKQRVIYSGSSYYHLLDEQEISLEIQGVDYQSLEQVNGDIIGNYYLFYELPSPGTWSLLVDLEVSGMVSGQIRKQGNVIWEYSSGNSNGQIEYVIYFHSTDRLDLEFEFRCPPHSVIAGITLRAGVYHDEDGNVLPEIKNLHEVNLSRAVPNMTFGDLVKIIKNWKNYDMVIEGKQVIMNQNRVTDSSNPKDFRFSEIKEPKRIFVNNRSYVLKYPEMDEDYEIDSYFISEDGIELNGVAEEDSNEILINGYCLPLESYRGTLTAIPKKDSDEVLGLIYYDGLSNGYNVAKNPAGLMPPEIIRHWGAWLLLRIKTIGINWTFSVVKNHFRKFKIRDTIYAYKKKLWITGWTKNVLNDRKYEIEIETEEVE